MECGSSSPAPRAHVVPGASMHPMPSPTSTDTFSGRDVQAARFALRSPAGMSPTGEPPSRRASRLPSDSSVSSGSRASSSSYHSVGPTTKAVETLSSKKRRLSAYNGQREQQRPRAKAKRNANASVHSDDEDADDDRAYAPQRPLDRRDLLAPRPASSEPDRTHQIQSQLTVPMAEHLFHHSSALLHRGTIENEVRAEDLLDEVRRQQEKRENYDRKIRSLQRELETMDPAAAAAYARGESIGLDAETWQQQHRTKRSEPQPSPPREESPQPDDIQLIPAGVQTREAAIRKAAAEWNAEIAAFPEELHGLDDFVEAQRLFDAKR